MSQHVSPRQTEYTILRAFVWQFHDCSVMADALTCLYLLGCSCLRQMSFLSAPVYYRLNFQPRLLYCMTCLRLIAMFECCNISYKYLDLVALSAETVSHACRKDIAFAQDLLNRSLTVVCGTSVVSLNGRTHPAQPRINSP